MSPHPFSGRSPDGANGELAIHDARYANQYALCVQNGTAGCAGV